MLFCHLLWFEHLYESLLYFIIISSTCEHISDSYCMNVQNDKSHTNISRHVYSCVLHNSTHAYADIERKLVESQADSVLWDASKIPSKGSSLPPTAGALGAKGTVKPGDKSESESDTSDKDSKQKGLPQADGGKKGQLDPRLLKLSLNKWLEVWYPKHLLLS
jgi:hypothetical protein